MARSRRIVMLGTRFDTKGGISSVVNVYRNAGLFARWPITYIPTHRDSGIYGKILIFVVAYLRYLGLLLVRRVTLVHVLLSSGASVWRKWLFCVPVYVFRVPVILHLHGGDFDTFYERDSGALTKCIIRMTFSRATRVIVLSETWRCWVVRAGLARETDIVPIANPVQVPTDPTDFELREPGTLLCLGRLGGPKGTYDLLEAVARIVGEFPELRLLLGGDGELPQVREAAARLGIGERVELLGWVSGDAKRQILASAAIYVLPSYYEGLPMSVLEAMADGLPIVTTTVGGLPEVVRDGIEGFLVQPGDVTALAGAIAQLLRDEKLRANVGEAARRMVAARFSIEVVLPKVEAIYRDLGACPNTEL
ncbi:MAG: glycosyltransferase family 4 protein [Acidiferrobacteraceae bacterium]